ncbi:MAG: RNA methyltransferase [Rhodospirillaceae bacterium]|nr:RNA methyltransferase [Rhodospirillaceae bacterium]
MRGYFGIGVEGLCKPMNLGALLRTAHAFGAGFTVIIGAGPPKLREMEHADTSHAAENVPLHVFPDLASLSLPVGCRLVGVELVEDAIPLPSFRHPLRAAYVLGAERSDLSPELLARCDFVVRIPTRFCVNLAVAGALVMYDRMLSLGRFAERPVRAGGPPAPPPPPPGHGEPLWKKRQRRREAVS